MVRKVGRTDYKRGLAMTKQGKSETQGRVPAKRRAWAPPTVRKISASTAETGGASPNTDLGVTFS